VGVITITRLYGAGGSRVAALVAGSLGWTVIDNEFISQVAERAGLPPDEVAAREERAPSLVERLVRALASASPEVFVPAAAAERSAPDEEALVRQTEAVIAKAAGEGRAVLVGRGATAFLATARPADALHVMVVAPREARIRVTMERLRLDEKAAAAEMDATDADRDRYMEKWYKRRRQDPSNYHLVLNTDWLGYDGAAHLVVAVARARGWG
jgi:cytidylate kinase